METTTIKTICRVCAAGHKITDEMVIENAHLGGDLYVMGCAATGEDGLCDECRAQVETYDVRAPGCTAWESGLPTLADAIMSLKRAEQVAGGPAYEIIRRTDTTSEIVTQNEIDWEAVYMDDGEDD